MSPITSSRLAALNLDWKVGLQSLWVDDRFGPRRSESRAVVREDNGHILGTVGGRYTPLQNHELADVATAIETSSDAKFETGGQFDGGRLVFMSLALPKDIVVDDRDHLKTFLVLSNPHDGTGSARVNVSTFRPSCKNGLRLAWSASVESIFERTSLRHTSGILERLKDVKANLAGAVAAVSEFEKQARLLRNTKPSERDVDTFLKAMGFSTDEAQGKKREDEMAFRKLMVTAPGQEMAGNSLWRLVNGATYYADHVKEYRKGTDKALSTQFGTASEWKSKALTTALDLAGVR